MNAVIVDLQMEYAAALCENGSIEKIPNAGYEIGQQIEMPAIAVMPKGRKNSGMAKFAKRAGTAAAALVLAAGLGSGIAYAMPYGTVSLDSDASVEYTINCFNRVIGVTAANDEGTAVLESLDSSLMNKDIEDAVAITIEQIDAGGYLDGDSELVISVGTKGEEHAEQLARCLNEMAKNDMPVPAQVVPVTMDDIDAAHENDMTAGQKWMQDNTRPENGSDYSSSTGNVQDGAAERNASEDASNAADAARNPDGENGANGQSAQAGASEPGNSGAVPAADSSGAQNPQNGGEENNVQTAPPASAP